MLLLVQGRQCVELDPAVLPVDAPGIAQVEDRVALAAKENPLVVRGHEARTPEAAEEALLGEAAARVHDHVARQVLVHGAKTVAQPGAAARAPGYLAAGLDVGDGRVVVDHLGEGAVYDAELLCHARRMGQQFTDPHAAIIVLVLGKLVLARGHRVSFLAGGHAGKALPVTDLLGQLLAVHLLHLRLVIPEVVVARAATHEKVDDSLGLRLVVRPGRGSLCGELGPEQVGHRCGAEAKGGAAEELPPGHHQVVFTQGIRVDHEFSL